MRFTILALSTRGNKNDKQNSHLSKAMPEGKVKTQQFATGVF